MKKVLKTLLLMLAAAGLMSCASVGEFKDVVLQNKKIDIPFEGPMDTRFGYESLEWGTSYSKIRKAGVYPIIKTHNYNTNEDRYFFGEEGRNQDGSTYKIECGHKNVNETEFFFTPDTETLYMVQEVLDIRNPSLKYLHSRYGDFNEENAASDKFKAKGGITYLNKGFLDETDNYSLKIDIKANGKTTVTVYDPFAYATLNKSPKWDRDYTYLKNNTWYCWANIDGNKKAVNYTFVQKNADAKKLIFGYHKSLESLARSYVRAGFGWGSYTRGKYEIKTDTGIISYDFSEAGWYCAIIDVIFGHTEGEYRKMLNTFLSGEKLTVRRDDRVTEFNAAGFSEILKKWGITAEELDYAIANEEF